MDSAVQHWFVLNHIPLTRSKSETPKAEIERFNTLGYGLLDIFAPTFVKMVEVNGKMVRKDVPLAFHYVFVRGTTDEVKKLCNLTNGFSFVLDRGSEFRYLTVSSREMEAFRIIARAYGNNLPCYTIDEVNLEEGDLIEVIDGNFAGLVGTYLPKKGSKSGNIILTVSQKFATVAYDIKASYVRILEFGKNTGRAYDQIDAFIPTLLKALRIFHTKEDLPSKLIGSLSVFCSRYEIVRLENPKTEAKLALLLMCANRILGNHERLACARIRFEKSSHAVTNPWTTALIRLLSGICFGDAAQFADGLALVSTLTSRQPLSASQCLIAAEYQYYQPLLSPDNIV